MKISPFSTILASNQTQLTDSILAAPPVASAPAASSPTTTSALQSAAAPQGTSGNILTVGPGQQYSTIEAAVQAAQSGDTIQVQAGTYTDDFVTIDKSLTLEAVGGVVKMVETTSPPNGKAMIDEGGVGLSVSITGFDISGVAVADANGSAVRYEGGALTLNNDYFHDNQEGMLASSTDPNGTILINNSEFAFNGAGDGQSHNLYVNSIASLTITNSYFHDANVGHEIKSRAQNTTITGSRIFDNNSTASYSIEIANSGNANISNNQIEQGPNTQNPIIIWYGTESGVGNPGTTVTIDNNTIVNDETGSGLGVANNDSFALEMSGNQVYGLTSSNLTSGPVAVSNTTYLSTRPTLNTTSMDMACFAQGTRILTARGEVLVEELAEGDLIVTHTGEQHPLKWLGFRRIDVTRHKQPDLVAPVRICRDAIGVGQPQRDLLLSPDHCLFLDGRLIPAKLLINDMTIRQERGTPAVTYYHVELERHAVLLAEGLPVETYLDTGNRAFFANAGLALVLHPEFQVNAGLKQWATDACAPLTVDPVAVEPVWRRLAARAEELGHSTQHRATTTDPDLHIATQERAFRPVSEREGLFVFVLPPGTRSVRLISRSTVPSHAEPWLDDWRRLGVAVRRILLRSIGQHVELAPDDPRLGSGWHAVEHDASTMWRWTNGDADLTLPVSDGPVTLEVEVGIALAYPVDEALPAVSRAA